MQRQLNFGVSPVVASGFSRQEGQERGTVSDFSVCLSPHDQSVTKGCIRILCVCNLFMEWINAVPGGREVCVSVCEGNIVSRCHPRGSSTLANMHLYKHLLIT